LSQTIMYCTTFNCLIIETMFFRVKCYINIINGNIFILFNIVVDVRFNSFTMFTSVLCKYNDKFNRIRICSFLRSCHFFCVFFIRNFCHTIFITNTRYDTTNSICDRL